MADPAAPAKSSDVATPNIAHERMAPGWRLARALWGGTRTMREAGTAYLAREEEESDAAYTARLGRSVLFNAFKRTIKQLAGKPFAKPVTLTDTPAQIEEWMEDVDKSGSDLDSFAKDVFEEALQAGLCHILTDMPSAVVDRQGEPVKLSQADERQLGRRPYWVKIKADDLIGWKARRVGGQDILTQIRVREVVKEDEGDFGEVEVEQILVLEETAWTRWRLEDDASDKWVVFDSGPNTLNRIALATVYCGKTGLLEAEMPLSDLADLNVQHWNSSSDQEHILHVARVPLLFGKGLAAPIDPDGVAAPAAKPQFTIGPNRMIRGPADSDLKYVEHTGAAIGAGRSSLQDIEDRMVVMGLELQVRKPAVQTATQKIIDTRESDSELHGFVNSLAQALSTALDDMAAWVGIDGGGDADLNKDFGITQREAAEIDTLLRMRQANEISRQTFYQELSRRGFLSDSFDPEAEMALIETEAQKMQGEALALAEAQGAPQNPGLDQTAGNA